jgi:hypothetical protein
MATFVIRRDPMRFLALEEGGIGLRVWGGDGCVCPSAWHDR